MSHHIKLNTSSGGKKEVLRALHRRNTRSGRERSLADVTRFLGPHYSSDDVLTVLQALESDGYATHVGDNWGLTSDGLVYIRSHPDSREVAA